LQWSLEAIAFMLPTYQMGLWAGIAGLTLMTPAALTSSDWMMKKLGASPGGSGLQNRWRQIHLLTVPALLCCVLHTVLIGSHYLGNLERHPTQILVSVGLIALTSGVLILRLIQRKR
jgi:DMSO/TMAO reductase YedYZ heme-binding membrane subunit